MENEIVNNERVTYKADQTPPVSVLIFSAIQNMLLVISLGMSVSVVLSKTCGLDLEYSSSLLSACLFGMGIQGILQTIKGKYIGSGFLSMSTVETATIAVCVMSAEIGGIPLVLGMTIFSGLLKFVLGSFTFKLRKLFTPEVTGSLIFLLGINLIPTGFKYFLGSAESGVYDYRHIITSVATLIVMLVCTLFIKKLKHYSAIIGIAFGFIFSYIIGIFDSSSILELSKLKFVSLPVYKELSFAFDIRMVVPFAIVTIASLVDNIADFSAVQSANDNHIKKYDWKSITNGIRGGGLGTAISALIGCLPQSTATTNIGISKASGVTSRKVGYLACILMIVISVMPGVTGFLSLIPEPVLGAVLLFGMCYIMAGGFQTLITREIDDKKIFVIFLSIGFACSTIIPGLYSFIPDEIEKVIASPMIMGVIILIITSLLTRIGTKKKFNFTTGSNHNDIINLNKELEGVCKQWVTERKVLTNLQVCLDGLLEGLYEINTDTKSNIVVMYDQIQLKLRLESLDTKIKEDDVNIIEKTTSLSIAINTLRNVFDNVNVKVKDDKLYVNVDLDV